MKNILKHLCVVLFISFMAYLITSCGITGQRALIDYDTVNITVRPGDTLWELGAVYCPKGTDLREWIHEVRAINKTTSIYAWQEICVPTDYSGLGR